MKLIQDPIREESRKKPAEIERDLAQTRAKMDDTIRAIEQKFTPADWLDQTVKYVSSGSQEYIEHLTGQIKRTPLPFALAGIGISWVVVSSVSKSSHMSPQAEEVFMKGKHGLAKEKFGAAGGQLRARIETLMEEKPLALGALVFFLGAAVGAILPATRKESRMMGRKRDEVMGRAEKIAQEQIERIKQAAERAEKAAKEEFQQSIEESGEKKTPEEPEPARSLE